MSNYFKQNSRFGALNEEINGNKVFKKGDRRDDRRDDRRNDLFNNKSNNFSYRERQFANSALREEQIAKNEQKRLEEERQKNLSAESFPQLISLSNISIKETNTSNCMPSFLEKITTQVEKKEVFKSEQQIFIKPGWALFTYDKETNKTTMIEKQIIRNEKKSLSELDITYNVFEALANLHENRRQEYIDNWGEDEYEKMFIFQNYDYDYFNKLDQKYEEEIIKYNNAIKQQDDDDYYED